MKNKAEYVRDWILKARSDLNTAHWCLQAEEVPTDTVCFHCQQAVEKMLKGWLVWRDCEFKPIHNLEALLTECERHQPEFSRLRGVGQLTFYAVEIRYPDDIYFPTMEEAREAIRLADEAYHFVKNQLCQDGWNE